VASTKTPPTARVRIAIAMPSRSSLFTSLRYGHRGGPADERRQELSRKAIAARNCAATVPIAEPRSPRPTPKTKISSSPTLTTLAATTIPKGDSVSCCPRWCPDPAKATKRNGSPSEERRRYMIDCPKLGPCPSISAANTGANNQITPAVMTPSVTAIRYAAPALLPAPSTSPPATRCATVEVVAVLRNAAIHPISDSTVPATARASRLPEPRCPTIAVSAKA
jgi:hypothetical protein